MKLERRKTTARTPRRLGKKSDSWEQNPKLVSSAPKRNSYAPSAFRERHTKREDILDRICFPEDKSSQHSAGNWIAAHGPLRATATGAWRSAGQGQKESTLPWREKSRRASTTKNINYPTSTQSRREAWIRKIELSKSAYEGSQRADSKSPRARTCPVWTPQSRGTTADQ